MSNHRLALSILTHIRHSGYLIRPSTTTNIRHLSSEITKKKKAQTLEFKETPTNLLTKHENKFQLITSQQHSHTTTSTNTDTTSIISKSKRKIYTMSKNTYYNKIILEFDGSSKNNPVGPAGCGFVLYEMDDDGAKAQCIGSDSSYLGYDKCNHQAEYQGLILGMNYIRQNLQCHGLYIRGDAKSVIEQMNGDSEARSPNILPYYNRAKRMLDKIDGFDCDYCTFKHIPRNQNKEADELAKYATTNN